MNRAIFLDRDNTIIENDGDLGDPAKVKLLKGAAAAIASMRGLGYKVIVVTNQGGVARGKYSEDDVNAVHQKINDVIGDMSGSKVDCFYYCPFHPKGSVPEYQREHPWRKPQPGMLLQAAQDFDLDLEQCWMIGDQPRDVQAGKAAGTRTILLRPDAAETPLPDEPGEENGVSSDAEDGRFSASGAETENDADDGDSPVVTMDAHADAVARSLTEAVRIVAQARRPGQSRTQAEPAARKATTEPARQPRETSETKPEPAAQAVATKAQEDSPAPEKPAKASTPATEAKPATKPVGQRPFKPWTRQEVSYSKADPQPEEATAHKPEPTHSARETEKPEPKSQATTPSQRELSRASQSSVRDTATKTQQTSNQSQSTEAASESEEISTESTSSSRRAGKPIPAESTLREILQELRNQRVAHREFSYLEVAAIVFQLVAGVCFIAALLLGQSSDDLFYKWILASLFVQLVTLAALLFRLKP